MKLALAQIDARLGDFDGICSRIEDQARLAHEAGADLLCLPAPLFCGVTPGTFAEYPNYEHDLLLHLQRVACAVEPLGIACLVPAVLSLEAGQLFEVFLLRRGRVVPLRLVMIRHADEIPVSPWSPPVFEVAGTRIAATFDVMRDIESIPGGCDLVIYFPVNGFDATDVTTAGVAAVGQGAFRAEVERAGVWLACMSPVGGFDAAVYPGGSFVMDDGGRVVAAAPCFEESLLVQEVQRGMMVEALDDHELPKFHRETWLWEALRLHLRDAVEASGRSRVVVPLTGDLASSLLAVLAVDALGPRNVFGLLTCSEGACTPAAVQGEVERVGLVREIAERLHLRLVERTSPSAALVLDRDVPCLGERAARAHIEAVLLADTAREQHAVALSPLTKTDAALRANVVAPAQAGELAPFGDLYLASLEWLARSRNRSSAVLPARLVTLDAVRDAHRAVIADGVSQLDMERSLVDRAEALLLGLDPAQLDGALESHVDRNSTLEELPVFSGNPEAAAVLTLLVRCNEGGRRMLPPCPIVSARSFSERMWPVQLAWSDFGLRGDERLCAGDFAEAEYQRLERKGNEHAQRARGEVLGMLGDLLGLSPEQQQELFSDEGQERMREELQELEGNLREMFRRMAESGGAPGGSGPAPNGPPSGGFNFFSLN